MTKQRRGSTDLEWISKYQQSDHHVDRQTRKNLEFPRGLPPTPNFTDSPGTARRAKYEQESSGSDLHHNYPLHHHPQLHHPHHQPHPRQLKLGLPPVGRLSASPRISTENLLATVEPTAIFSRQRSNSLSQAHPPLLAPSVWRQRDFTPVGRNHAQVSVGGRNGFAWLGVRGPTASGSTPASRRGSVVDHVTLTLPAARSSRATSVPGWSPSLDSSAWKRSSFAASSNLPDVQSYGTAAAAAGRKRRSSLAPGLNGGSYSYSSPSSSSSSYPSSYYNHDIYKRSSIYDGNSNNNNDNNGRYNSSNKFSSFGRSYGGPFAPQNIFRTVDSVRF